MNKKVVLFDLQTGGHHIKYVLYLVRYLCKKGDEIMFITLKEDNRTKLLPKDEPGLTVQFIDNNTQAQVKSNFVARHLQMLGALERCFKLASAWKADIVCIMQLDYNIFSLFLEALKWRHPGWRLFGFLVWPHFLDNADAHVGLLRKAYYSLTGATVRRLLARGVLRGMFVHTIPIKQALSKSFGWQGKGCDNKLVVVPDPTEAFYGCCSMKEARDRLRLPVGIPILLFFGRLRWDKGPDLLLEAIKDIEDDFVLVIAGQPGYVTNSNIEAFQKNPKSSRVIARIEYIPEDEVKYYFLSADAVILPYRRVFKGTSGILQNAAAAGRPVIATDVGEIGRIVREYSLGLVVEPESQEALREEIKFFVRERRKIAPHVRECALAYAEAHHWRRMAELVEEAFRGCLRAKQSLEEAGGGAEKPAPWEQQR